MSYDKNGFPDFTPFAPDPKLRYKFESQTLSGKSGDITKANKEMRDRFKNEPDKFIWDGNSQNFSIKNPDGTTTQYTWHHHQDGRTMFPVSTKNHNKNHPGGGGFPHSGSNTIISRGLQDLFDPPILG